MNNTTKAKYDMAKKMIAGRLDVEDVVEMTELPVEEVQKLKDEFDKVMQTELSHTNLDMSSMIFDNYVTDEEMDDFEALKEEIDRKTAPKES